MNETEAAQGIKNGLLPSPWKIGDFALFAVRITGTGLAYRSGREEFCWRDPSIYLNDAFLQRCNGLPLIWEHPERNQLNSEEYAKRTIGAIVLSYIKGDEVWGIARVNDDKAITLMADGQLSTSPGVVFEPQDGNVKVEAPDGSVLLIEGNPSLLDHLAVCEAGVWDKGGPATGVLNDKLLSKQEEPIGMTPEEMAAADKARKDAADKLDKIMDALTHMGSRMDSMEAADKARKDAEEKTARYDAACKDKFGHRKDGEKYADWKKRHDADEAAMCDALCKSGETDDCAKTDAKRARHDAEEREKAKDAESFEKWAKEEQEEPNHKEADKARRDAEEKERMDKIRADAAAAIEQNAALQTRIASLEAVIKGVTRETPAEERDALAAAQARADSVAALFGDKVAAAIPGETPVDYRRRILERFKRHSPQFKDTSLAALDASTLGIVEDRVYADSVVAARRPATEAPGRLVPFTRTDEAGRKITEYHGDIGAFMAPFMGRAINGKFINPSARS